LKSPKLIPVRHRRHSFGDPVGLRHRRVAAFHSVSMATAEHKASVWSELCDFYDDGSSYGTLSQRIHGLQAAKQAAMAGAPKEVIVGALLHDIGWKLAREVSAAS
jgi:hypothetical protein